MPKNLVLIPVHNEESHIRSILSELRRHYAGDVLFVEDGSQDGSRAVIESLKSSRVLLLSHDKNAGYGASLLNGFGFATENGYESVVTMDCDWQHEPAYVPRFFAELSGWDVVSGSRYLAESPGDTGAPEDRRSINDQITKTICALTSYSITDSFCGFKSYRVAAFESLQLGEAGYGFPVEFWMQAAKNNLRIKELPVPRLYLDLARAFGGSLDNPEIRLGYYLSIIERERLGWNIASQS